MLKYIITPYNTIATLLDEVLSSHSSILALCAKKNCCVLIGSATVSSAKRATFRVENLVKLSCRKDYSAGPKTGGALLKRERGSELRQGDEKNWEEERRKRAMRDSSLAPAYTLAAAPRTAGDSSY